ncbi:MAG: bifunctional methionine sulfoxide reductase B/A protein [Candidatus Aminicenantes bacterium]|nr:bifunctional methionine sulfoxide reductase B/A protein [Candidatus Aminicenantes bacterium]MDH5707388.1 bifunctional methionine sulfoxide reductase B/A protein [Candidatus Aminicenantes bacterium]
MRQKIGLAITVLVVLTAYLSLKPSFKKDTKEDQFSKGEQTMIKKVIKSDKEWKEILSPEQYRVMRKRGTERAFTGKYNDHYEKGIYVCAGCGTPLFSSETKYDHSTGWPSFTATINENHIDYFDDYSHFMHRTETRCALCGAHLGHVFDDGPEPTGKHYCINSVSLDFKPAGAQQVAEQQAKNKSDEKANEYLKAETAIFAAGCFWGIEQKFGLLPGVISTVVGYTGGHKENPTYRQVCSDKTGHAEAVKLTFDPNKISYQELLEFFFKIHDPTQVNRQGPDVGTQYRSAIFYLDQIQKEAAEKLVEKLNNSGQFKKPIATQIVPDSEFYKAEEYHQKYYEKRKKESKRECGPGSCSLE